LEPLRPRLDDSSFERLVSGRAVVLGWEALIVLQDLRELFAVHDRAPAVSGEGRAWADRVEGPFFLQATTGSVEREENDLASSGGEVESLFRAREVSHGLPVPHPSLAGDGGSRARRRLGGVRWIDQPDVGHHRRSRFDDHRRDRVELVDDDR
jgi:hypothetical protein